MKEKTIELVFKSSMSFLTGRSFATSIFNKQIKENLSNGSDYDEIIIRYPNQISGISISFTKQLLSEINNNFPNENNKISFRAGSLQLEDKIKEDIIF